MNKQQYLFFIILILLSIGLFVFFLSNENRKEDRDPSLIPYKTITDENFTLKYTYLGDSEWEYTVTGQLPNPCYQASTETLIMESYPEKVAIIVNVSEPEDDVMCTQVIYEYEYSGEFSASEKAAVALQVEGFKAEPVVETPTEEPKTRPIKNY